MEEVHRWASEAAARNCVEGIVAGTCGQIKMRKMGRLLKEKLPITYLSYIQKVSQVMQGHGQPVREQRVHKTITEPEEMFNCFRKAEFEWRQEGNRLVKKESGSTKKSLEKRRSICLSSKTSRRSEEKRSRRFISRKRIQLEVPRLVPLAMEEKDKENEGESRIEQLRSRKIKYEQALRQFREEEEKQMQRVERRRKEKVAFNFTTDFKGKIISFCPKVSKMKEVPPIAVKVDTVIDSNRPWGNISFTATKTRKHFREFAADVMVGQE